MAKRLTREEFIQKAIERHGDKYDYSLVEYKNYSTKVKIKCSVHGEFEQTPNNHIVSGCYKCAKELVGSKNAGTKERFVVSAAKVHGDKYDYSLVEYKNTSTPVAIICKKHGAFMQKPHDHVTRGFGCAKCSGVARVGVAEFIERARAVHGNRYNYSQVIYKSGKSNVTIICNEHGPFEQTPDNHLKGKGCSICVGRLSFSTESFIQQARAIHGDDYDYSEVDYKGSVTKVKIICRQHGAWEQTPANHLTGYGCPKCVRKISKPEIELFEFISSMFPDAYQTDRKIIAPKELDIVVPSKRVAIEYNGLHYHSDRLDEKPENYHAEKTQACSGVGYRLIHVWEDDWRDKRDVVKRNLMSILGVTHGAPIFARKCSVKVIAGTSADAIEFYNKNHIQGWVRSSRTYSLLFDDRIVAMMSFSRYRDNKGATPDGVFELVRYATSERVVGGAGKLLSAFLKDSGCTSVVSYSSNDMYVGGMYESLGFIKERVGKPDYKVIHRGVRRHKSGYRLSRLRDRLGEKFDPNLTERENCRNNGLFRVYDCGLTKWVFTRR